MPDIAVGPSTDIIDDPNAAKGPKYGWRVSGEASVVCTTSEDPVVRRVERGSAPWAARLARFIEGCASAKPTEDLPLSDIQPPSSSSSPIFVRVSIKGQVQFNVDGGDFFNWDPTSFEGDHFVRVTDGTNYMDTKIKEGGKVELNFTSRLSGALSLSSFNQAMDAFHFFRTKTGYAGQYPDQQKACSSFSCTPLNNYMWDMKTLVSPTPNYGAGSDFSNVSACEASPSS
jgi:hypothetical protein